MPYRRGDVVLVPFPYTDDDTFKQRPALVVQSDSLITGFQQRVMAQITTQPRVGASRVQVKVASVEGKAMGLLTDSSLVLDKLETLDDSLVIKTLGKAPPHTMALVDNALRATFDL
jgi:mRNA-degrading endonuclease toxin of MazEF toxin-antitoxin module